MKTIFEMFAVGKMSYFSGSGGTSRFMNAPSYVHLGVAKRVPKYLKGTASLGLWYEKIDQIQLVGYTDSDWAGCIHDNKSTSKYVFTIDIRVISWNAKKQDVVAQSTT